MRIVGVIAVTFSLLTCLMVYVMSLLGWAEPNVASDEGLLLFYCTLFGYTFAAFPLAMVSIGLFTAISRAVEKMVYKV